MSVEKVKKYFHQFGMASKVLFLMFGMQSRAFFPIILMP